MTNADLSAALDAFEKEAGRPPDRAERAAIAAGLGRRVEPDAVASVVPSIAELRERAAWLTAEKKRRYG